MSRTRRRAKREEYDDERFVPPHDPLFLKGVAPQYEDGDLVLGLDYMGGKLPDPIPRVGLVIDANCQCDVYGEDVLPRVHRVMWADGEIEVQSDDDLAPVAHS